MPGSSEESAVATLWELRLSSRLRIPPAAVGALVSLALIGGHLCVYRLAGLAWLDPGEAFGIRESSRSFIFFAVLLGYTLGTFGHVASRQDRDLHELGLIDLQGDSLRAITTDFLTGSRIAGGAGVLIGLGVMETLQRTLRSEFSIIDLALVPEWAPLLPVWSLAWWVIGRALHASMLRTPLDDALEGPVDLLDMRLFRARGRSALRVSTAFIIGISLMTPWIFVPGFSTALVPFIAVSLAVPTLLLVVPVRGARRRIREAKRAELASLDAQIRAARSEALGGDTAAQAWIGFLASYRSLVEGVREWPFETTTWTRFGLYLLIPLGSWLASALVERLVDAALD